MIKEPDPIPATPVTPEAAELEVKLLTIVEMANETPKLKPLHDEALTLLEEMAAAAAVRIADRNEKIKAREAEIARLKAEEAAQIKAQADAEEEARAKAQAEAQAKAAKAAPKVIPAEKDYDKR